MACDDPHRRATRSWPKTLGSRLYESLSALLGISLIDLLEGRVDGLRDMGIRRFRLSPQDVDMVAVAKAYRAVLDGRMSAGPRALPFPARIPCPKRGSRASVESTI